MKIGKYEIRTLETGWFGLDGGAMFGIIPKNLWERTNPADEKNRIKLGGRVLLLQEGSRNIIVDTGIGEHWNEKFQKIYAVDHSDDTLIGALKKAGLEPEDITDVILTHLHFDHAGGSVREENGKMIPAFSNAKYYSQKEQWEWGNNPSDKDRGSYEKDRFLPLREHGVLEFFEGNTIFDDGIELLPVNGHTFSQQMVKVSDSSQTILFCGDLFPTSSHIPYPYIMGYDLEPLVTVKEKKKYLPKIVEEEWKLVFGHDPYFTSATVEKTDRGFQVKEKFERLV